MTAAVLALASAAGCETSPMRERSQVALHMALEARDAAGRLPESDDAEAVAERIDRVVELLGGEPGPEGTRLAGAVRWYELFGPEAVKLSYFTQFADFNDDGASDGLIARVRLEDRFGDPVKALGGFRIETFQYIAHAGDHRGAQLSNWYIGVFAAEDVRTYYDSMERSFRFPLQYAGPIAGDRVVVQVTYYLPDGSGRQMFDRRVVKAGEPESR